MSLGKQKNLMVVAAVAAALLVGGVLVADYADILTAGAKADQPVKACQSGEAKPCCAGKAEAAGFAQVPAAATQATSLKSCSGGEEAAGCSMQCGPGKSCCVKPCPPEFAKPCCAKEPACCEKSPAGCREEGQQAEATASCCAAKPGAATE